MVLTALTSAVVAGIVAKYGEVRKLNLSSNGKPSHAKCTRSVCVSLCVSVCRMCVYVA
jgi:hypothetical protein